MNRQANGAPRRRVRQWLLGMAAAGLVAASAGGPVRAQGGNDCSAESYAVHPELLQKAFDKAVGDSLDAAGKAALQKLLTDRRLTVFGAQQNSVLLSNIGSPAFRAIMNNLPQLLNAVTAVDAIAAGDYAKLKDTAFEVGGEQALAAAGVPFAGQVIATYQITKLSYTELRHQDCLLNIDVAYYKFLDDPRLNQGSNYDRTAYYLDQYVRGGGADPTGGTRAANRTRLQCYIDESLPADQRPEIDTGGGALGTTPFSQITDATVVARNPPGLRVSVLLMLQDFATKRKIEQQRERALKLQQSPDFAALKEALPLLASYPILAQMICDQYLDYTRSAAPAGGAETGTYRLVGIDVTRSYPEPWVQKPGWGNPQQPGLSHAGAGERSFRMGWDGTFKSGMAEFNYNGVAHAAATVTLQAPDTLSAGQPARFDASIDGEWKMKGYGVDRDHTVSLSGAAGSARWSTNGTPSGDYSGSARTGQSITLNGLAAGHQDYNISARINFGGDNWANMEIVLHYAPAQ